MNGALDLFFAECVHGVEGALREPQICSACCGADVTEARLRDLYVWLAAHRLSLIEHAGLLAECAGWARSAHGRDAPAVLDRLSDRLQTLAREHAAALETLDRIHPPPPTDFRDEDEDTIPHCLRDLLHVRPRS